MAVSMQFLSPVEYVSEQMSVYSGQNVIAQGPGMMRTRVSNWAQSCAPIRTSESLATLHFRVPQLCAVAS
ncbi:hypothetical protein GQ600_13836 [Phytophthora cactorum]|nr:hypothetical protein GQ600_13836 [Phytophthora cactorum]